MAVDRNIVWRVRAYEVGGVVAHEKGEGALVTGISADQFVAPQQPKVAHPRNGGGAMTISWDSVLDPRISALRGTFAGLVPKHIDFCAQEASHFTFEIKLAQALY